MKMTEEIHHAIIGKRVLRDSIELITVQELSIILNISESTIYRAIRKNVISKDEAGKLLPMEIHEAILKKRLKCDPRNAEEFRRMFIYR